MKVKEKLYDKMKEHAKDVQDEIDQEELEGKTEITGSHRDYKINNTSKSSQAS